MDKPDKPLRRKLARARLGQTGCHSGNEPRQRKSVVNEKGGVKQFAQLRLGFQYQLSLERLPLD
jgi:hypothetical protein